MRPGRLQAFAHVSPDGKMLLGGRELFQGGLAEFLEEARRTRAEGGRHLVITLNVDQVLNWQDSKEFRAAYQGSALRTIDGAPLLALCRLLGGRKFERITGADLLPATVQASATDGTTVAITGGSHEALEAAGHNLRTRFPGSRVELVAFPHSGEATDPLMDATVTAHLRRLKPDFTFICLGSPKQELWFTRVKDSLPPGVYVGAGAAVDFAAGRISRAPRFMQRIGSEWLWRLWHEPRRLWRRYLLKGPKFIGVVVRSLRMGKVA